MNISSNNMRGFSQYSLLNKLFSQKNGNKTSTSNQMGAAISGGVKHIYPFPLLKIPRPPAWQCSGRS